MLRKLSPLQRLIFIVTSFAIAMGFLESAVVVYLREIYYPEGFDFPLQTIDAHIAITEILREAATVIMLLTLGYLTGKNLATRFAWFIYSFAIWDIFYYVFLKFLLNWPESLMTDDILFLIPVTWVGPVITPVIVSLSMIGLAFITVVYDNKGVVARIEGKEWGILILGSIILIVGFTWDYSRFILQQYSFAEIWNMPDKQALYDTGSQYIPVTFNWFLFSLGEVVILTGIVSYWRRLSKTSKSSTSN